MKEILEGEFFPAQKSKQRVTVIGIEHTKPINRKKVVDFLKKQAGGTVKVATYKNAIITEDL